MGTEENARLARIESHLLTIAEDIGGIRQFMATSTQQTAELFKKANTNTDSITKIANGGCAHIKDHESVKAMVENHEKVLNKATGIWIGTSAIGGVMGALIAFFAKMIYKQ